MSDSRKYTVEDTSSARLQVGPIKGMLREHKPFDVPVKKHLWVFVDVEDVILIDCLDSQIV